MKKRKDGQETQGRILQAASEVFAEQGYRDATVSEICRRAEANVASVNYYFGDKQSLYDEVWLEAVRVADELYPFDGGVAADAEPALRLEAHVRSLLRRMTDSGRLGHFHRLMMKEQGSPTGVIGRVFKESRRPFFQQLMRVVQELLGPAAKPGDVKACVRNVIGMCRTVRIDREMHATGDAKPFTRREVEKIGDQIVAFALSGIAGIREQLEGKRQKP